jgi:ATP/maltotriose-dependent transcriptional regulator MalT
VVLHGASGDEQSSGDLSVGLPLGSQASDLIVRRRNLIEALDRGDRLSSLATMHHVEHLEQPISRDVSVARRLLDREDLFQMLDRAVSKRVTMVSAPPGSGKTSLLRAWAARSASLRRVVSVSVDRDEEDAQRFWSAVLDEIRSSARSIDPQTQYAAAIAVDADQLVDTVVSELAEQAEPVVLIIDDLHELKSADALALLERLLAALPSSARVVLSSRRDPAIKAAPTQACRRGRRDPSRRSPVQ